MRKNLIDFLIIFGVGLNAYFIPAIIMMLGRAYLPHLYSQPTHDETLNRIGMGLSIAYIYGAYRLSHLKLPKAQLLLRLIISPAYAAIVVIAVLTVRALII